MCHEVAQVHRVPDKAINAAGHDSTVSGHNPEAAAEIQLRAKVDAPSCQHEQHPKSGQERLALDDHE